MIFKVEQVNSPLVKGETYLVPCFVKTGDGMTSITTGFDSEEKTYITPVINHPHSDIENGQGHSHYHVDYRFVNHKANGLFPTVINNHSKYHYVTDIRPTSGDLEYFIMTVVNEDFAGITSVSAISKSDLKGKCIHKGKCPHRGYDLSQVKEVGGKITCPLHGLQFNAKTGMVENL